MLLASALLFQIFVVSFLKKFFAISVSHLVIIGSPDVKKPLPNDITLKELPGKETTKVPQFNFQNLTKSVYRGGSFNGARNGTGTMYYRKGHSDDYVKYVGLWKNNGTYGLGRMTFTNGEILIGNWRGHTKPNTGTLLFDSNSSYALYQGQFQNGLMYGKGNLTWKDGSRKVQAENLGIFYNDGSKISGNRSAYSMDGSK